MPINLITGLPGHGKTLYALQWIKSWSEREGRAVFHNGIPDLKLPWQVIAPEEWRELEPGAIVVLDECQTCLPTRTRGAPPEWIEELAKHRHRGVDFVLITQNPMLFDSFARRLVDRHFHVVRKFGSNFATVYEFPNGVRENVATNREGGIRHEWRYPREVFGWYKSAELHTVSRRVPARVWVLLAIPFVFAGLVWVAWSRLSAHQEGAEGSTGAQAQAPGGVPPRAGPGSGERGPAAVGEYLAALAPRVPGLPHTAPAYDGVTAPAVAPYPAACVASSAACRCYTEQATRLDMPEDLCRSFVERGFFVAWRGPASAAPVEAAEGGKGPP